MLRYSEGDAANGWNLSGMAYQARWNATDQIPKRAVDAGKLGRFDTIDSTDGGESHRYSVSGAWRRNSEASSTQVNAYLIDWKLKLFSNFTYQLDDPVNGDQFAQPDRRRTAGVNAVHTRPMSGLGMESWNTLGVQFQNDNILTAWKAREPGKPCPLPAATTSSKPASGCTPRTRPAGHRGFAAWRACAPIPTASV